MSFEILGYSIPVIIKRKNNKNIYMRFNDNALVVTAHPWVTTKEIASILEKNRKSLEKMWEKSQLKKENDDAFYYLGKTYNIEIDEKRSDILIENNNIYCKDLKSLKKFYEQECKRVFEMEVQRIKPYFNNIPSFTLKIRKMKTRWGVNNLSSKTITLNSELLKKDLDLIDYVIIHELCHFYHANHSLAFWNEVSKYYPKYKEARKRLRG